MALPDSGGPTILQQGTNALGAHRSSGRSAGMRWLASHSGECGLVRLPSLASVQPQNGLGLAGRAVLGWGARGGGSTPPLPLVDLLAGSATVTGETAILLFSAVALHF